MFHQRITRGTGAVEKQPVEPLGKEETEGLDLDMEKRMISADTIDLGMVKVFA